jgi:hypothetical protein
MPGGSGWCEMDGDRENAKRYWLKAEGIRATATPMRDATIKKMLMDLAADYDAMASSLDRIVESERLLKS